MTGPLDILPKRCSFKIYKVSDGRQIKGSKVIRTFRNPRKFSVQVESGILGIGVCNSAQGIRNPADN